MKEVEHPDFPQATLCFLVKGDEVLLAMKKRGFGKGKWNGVGGKPNPGESIEQTAIRETLEEIEVVPRDLQLCAILDFNFPHKPDWDQRVTVYLCQNWQGEPQETEEMKPRWFSIGSLPLEAMWSDDKHWLPLVLAGQQLKGNFSFAENDELLDFEILPVDSLLD